MDESVKLITEGLRKAIQTESDGYHFYSMAAASIQDAKGKKVFARLAQEELGHMKFLKSHYDSFVESGKPDSKATLGARSDLSGASPIFSEEIKSRIAEAHFEMMALSVAIKLELSSRQYYLSQSEATSNSQVKAFFGELADWESSHYQALLAQQESLKEDYWDQGGFAPF
jgi:rubrerythrin